MKNLYPHSTLIGSLLVLAAASTMSLLAQTSPASLRVSLPFTAVDSLDGAPFKIRVPANWNGTLLVYLLTTKSGSPPAEPALVPPLLRGSDPPLEETLIQRGYALAASQVSTSDWQQKAETQDSLALTAYFRGRVGEPTRVILIGSSLGGFTATKLIEDFPRSFDGALSLSAPAAGHPLRFDRMLDVALAYDAVFGWPEAKWGPIGDVKPFLNFATEVNPFVQWPKADGSNRGAWEFIRLVSRLAQDGFWTIDPIFGYTGYFFQIYWATVQRESLESWATGPVAQNLDHTYTLRPEDKAYLATLGVKADDLLAKMNARAKISPCLGCRDYATRFGSVRGALTKPVIALHNTGDGIADIAHEGYYRDLVATQDRSKYLYQAFVPGPGHSAFTPTQILTGLAALEAWIETGARPTTATFPEAQGFDNRFVAPSWPY